MATLSTLPPELLHYVCDDLETSDILAFAKTSRQNYTVAGPALYRREVMKGKKSRVLHWAAQHGSVETVKMAIAAGADPSQQWESKRCLWHASRTLGSFMYLPLRPNGSHKPMNSDWEGERSNPLYAFVHRHAASARHGPHVHGGPSVHEDPDLDLALHGGRDFPGDDMSDSDDDDDHVDGDDDLVEDMYGLDDFDDLDDFDGVDDFRHEREDNMDTSDLDLDDLSEHVHGGIPSDLDSDVAGDDSVSENLGADDLNELDEAFDPMRMHPDGRVTSMSTSVALHWTALHQAAYSGRKDAVDALLDSGADIDAPSLGTCECTIARSFSQSRVGLGAWTPLHLAICRGHTSLAKHLLRRGASIHVDGHTVDAPSPTGGVNTNVGVTTTALHSAAATGNVALIKFITEGGFQTDYEARDRRGTTPLGYAYLRRKWRALSWLASKGASLETAMRNPLLLDACVLYEWVAALRLVNLGADASVETSDGRGLLHLVCHLPYSHSPSRPTVAERQRSILIKRLISKGADPEKRCSSGRTPLIDAAFNHIPSALDALLSAGANPNATMEDGTTALMLMCRDAGESEVVPACVRKLLHAGASASLTDSKGRSALHIILNSPDEKDFEYKPMGDMAVVMGLIPSSSMNMLELEGTSRAIKYEIMKLLLDHGADPNARQGSHNRTPLTIAFYHHDLASCKTLLDRGAVVTDDDAQALCDEATDEAWAPGVVFTFGLEKHGAKKPRVWDEFKLLSDTVILQNASDLEMLLDIGLMPDVNVQCRGKTLLHAVARHEDAKTVPILVARGADVNAMSPNSHTPLHIAIAHSNYRTAEALVSAGADPHITRNQPHYKQPLAVALQRVGQGDEKALDIAKLMLKSQQRSRTPADNPAAPRGVYLQVLFSAARKHAPRSYDPVHLAVRALLEAGEDPSVPDAKGINAVTAFFRYMLKTPAHLLETPWGSHGGRVKEEACAAFAVYFSEILALLLSASVDINAKDSSGKSAVDRFKDFMDPTHNRWYASILPMLGERVRLTDDPEVGYRITFEDRAFSRLASTISWNPHFCNDPSNFHSFNVS